MPRETIDRCDRCGAVRGNGNHWFLNVRQTDPNRILIEGFKPDAKTVDGRLLCGESCVLAEVSDYMQNSKTTDNVGVGRDARNLR